jgi:iron complex outermembrane receptor protein
MLFVFMGLCLAAQEPGAAELLDLKAALDKPISSANRRLQRLKEAPADATVLSGLELQELGYRTLGQALEGVLGFRTNRDRAYEGLGVRGLYVLGDQNTRVLILLDGHALNNPVEVGSSKVGEDFGIPLDFIERIEVIRGPASSLYGNNAFLGMVNVVTRIPPDRFQGEAGLHGSSQGGAALDFMGGGPTAGTRWNLFLSNLTRPGEKTDFPALGTGLQARDLDREDRRSAYLRAKGGIWSFAGFTLSRTQHLPTAPFYSQTGSPEAWYENRISFGDLRFEPVIGPVETLLRLTADRNTFLSAYRYEGGRLPGTEGAFTESDPDRSTGLELQVRVPLEKVYLTAGYENQWHRYEGDAGMPGARVQTRVGHRVENAYFQFEWKVADAFDLVAGVQRAEWTVSAASRADPVRTDFPRSVLIGATPRFSFIWRPTGLDIFKLLYGGGYRNPTIFERYYDDGGSFAANPELRPERIETFQGIWSSIWTMGLRSQVAFAQSRWSRLIQPADTGDGFQQFRNLGPSIDGTALEAELQGNWVGWSAYAQAGFYAWKQGGSALANVANVQSSVRVVRRWQGLSASLELRHLGARSGLGGSAVPASTRLRFALRKELSRGWLRFTVEDLGPRRRDLVARDYDPVTQIEWEGASARISALLRF